jgi:KipI family sensor histidine kinase inhibitor
MRFLPVNLDALLVELDDLPQTLALLASLQSEPVAGIEELVPAARTLLVRYRPGVVSHGELAAHIGARSLTAPIARARTLVEIPVDYQGEDLDEVAQLLGISRDEVIRRHTGSEYTVAFTGFAPGFAYLSGGHPSFDVPRRKTPRTRIPAGAVGLAGQFSGVYPQASPGGWQIIGVTDTPMWDLGREVPALLQPGFTVRFVDVSGKRAGVLSTPAQLTKPIESPSNNLRTSVPAEVPHEGPALHIVSTGLQALFQDLGRHGQAGQGVSASGAMDPGALRSANRLVGNAGDTACIEIVYGGFQLVSRGETVVAFTGADTTIELTSANGARSEVPNHAAIALSDGDSLKLGEPRAGIRSYLAVRGGFIVAPVLGSRSTDTLAHVGPSHIKAGDVLPVHTVSHGAVVGLPERPRDDLPTTQQIVVLDVVMGPRTDWFTTEAIALLASQLWTVTPQSNRVGLRLSGEMPLTRANPAELPSEGTALGAIQVPPSGQPVLFLADHPLTGGYPVIGAVATHHLARAGQIPIGAQISFNPIRAFSATT